MQRGGVTAMRIRSRKRLPSGPCVPKDVFLVARSPRESRLRRAPGGPLEEAVSLAPRLPAGRPLLPPRPMKPWKSRVRPSTPAVLHGRGRCMPRGSQPQGHPRPQVHLGAAEPLTRVLRGVDGPRTSSSLHSGLSARCSVSRAMTVLGPSERSASKLHRAL